MVLAVAFFFDLLTVTRKNVIPNITFFVIPSHLCTLNISSKYAGLVVKHPREMLLECWRSIGSALCQKMRTLKLYVILKKIITKGMTYMQTAKI